MKTRVIGGAALALMGTVATVQAKPLWSDNSITLLKGSHYEVPYSATTDDDHRTVFTFEHVSGQSWGDIFLFVDRLESNDENNETYVEVSPRLSLVKLSGRSLAFGPIQDVLITTTAEFVSAPGVDETHYLMGPAVDLALPGFAFFQVNIYHRDNDSNKDSNWQLTPVWAVPFKLGSLAFLYDGFVDWRSASDDQHAETNFTSQLKWDLGALWQTEKTLYVGIEYVYWRHKFGLRDGSLPFDTHERNVNALLKLHF